MTPNKFPSFFLSLCLHLGLAALIIVLPSLGSKSLPPPSGMVISGMVTLGREGRAAPAPPKPETGKTATAPRPVQKPAEPEARTVAQVQKPVPPEPRPEVKPVEKPLEKPKPEPKPEAVPIPKEPEKKQPEKKKPPQANATKKAEPKKTETAKKEPPKKPQKPQSKKSAAEEALLALSKEVKQQETGKKSNAAAPPKGQRADDVLAAWGEELGSPNEDLQGRGSGADQQGDGPGGRGGDGLGSPGPYYEVIISRVRQNWSLTQRADRASYVAVVNIQIAPDGGIINRRIVTSSGNALYDTAVLLAIDNTTDLEPPPSPDLQNINIEFDSNEMNR